MMGPPGAHMLMSGAGGGMIKSSSTPALSSGLSIGSMDSSSPVRRLPRLDSPTKEHSSPTRRLPRLDSPGEGPKGSRPVFTGGGHNANAGDPFGNAVFGG